MRFRTLTITLPQPCDESWDNMQAAPGGRHCDSCAKTVLDFSGFTDAELLDFFSKPSSAGICCRLREDQLNRTIADPEGPSPRIAMWQRVAAVLLAAHLMIGDAVAQTRKGHQTAQVMAKKKPAAAYLTGKVAGIPEGHSYSAAIPVIFQLGDTVTVTAAIDSFRRFRIPLPKGFEGTIRWNMQQLGEGFILDGGAEINAGLIASGLQLQWQKPVQLDVMKVVSPPAYRTYGGLPVREYHEPAPKRPLLRRLFNFRKKPRR